MKTKKTIALWATLVMWAWMIWQASANLNIEDLLKEIQNSQTTIQTELSEQFKESDKFTELENIVKWEENKELNEFESLENLAEDLF